jgi:hypothetical protein
LLMLFLLLTINYTYKTFTFFHHAKSRKAADSIPYEVIRYFN